MTPDQLPSLVAAFGAPIALVLYMMMNAQKTAPPQSESVPQKLDAIKESVHSIELRLTALETEMRHLTGDQRPHR
jgi:hypothetical protein